MRTRLVTVYVHCANILRVRTWVQLPYPAAHCVEYVHAGRSASTDQNSANEIYVESINLAFCVPCIMLQCVNLLNPTGHVMHQQFNIQQLYVLSTQYLCVLYLKPTGYVMHQQFNIQQLYALSTLYLCVLYLSQNKQRFVPLIS